MEIEKLSKAELLEKLMEHYKLTDKIDEELSDRCYDVIEPLLKGESTLADAIEAKKYIREFYGRFRDYSFSADMLEAMCNRRIKSFESETGN